jgi:hypothetical protein
MIYLIASIDTDCDMTILVWMQPFYLKSRWEERGYAAEFADFIVRRQSMVGEA